MASLARYVVTRPTTPQGKHLDGQKTYITYASNRRVTLTSPPAVCRQGTKTMSRLLTPTAHRGRILGTSKAAPFGPQSLQTLRYRHFVACDASHALDGTPNESTRGRLGFVRRTLLGAVGAAALVGSVITPTAAEARVAERPGAASTIDGMMESKQPMPNARDLSSEELSTIKLFQDTT